MTALKITEKEVNQILNQPMEITDDVSWKLKKDSNYQESQLTVKHPQKDVILSIILSINETDRNIYSFTLLLFGERIRSIDFARSHSNKHTDKNKFYHEAHIHEWTNVCHGKWACKCNWEPNNSMEENFWLFCKYCGIKFSGNWSEPSPQQTQMFGDF
jgi:hypothetical protein